MTPGMAIEYMIGLDCPPKTALGIEGIQARMKARGTAETILAKMRATGDARHPEQIEIQHVVQGPQGAQKRTTTLAAMMQGDKELEPHAQHCGNCPASLETAFGCYGAIQYPIRAATEEWLVRLLPTDDATPSWHLLQRAIADFRYDGGLVSEMRRRSELYESKSPARGKLEVTSDQVIHMTFFVGHVQPAHAMTLALFLGLVPHGTAIEEFARATGSPDARRRFLDTARMPRSDGNPQIDTFIRFFSSDDPVREPRSQPPHRRMKHFLLIYDLVPDYLERRAQFREEHLKLAWSTPELVLGGALADPADQAILLFRAESPDVVEAFVKKDPYFRHGLVKSHRVRPWTTVVGEDAINPVRP